MPIQRIPSELTNHTPTPSTPLTNGIECKVLIGITVPTRNWKDLFGLLTIKGLSAGYGMGSCNWIITSSTEKVAYISHTSLLHSHVLPFDDSTFEDTDILIIGTINMYASNQLEKTVEEFCHIVVQTLARGGNVLVPSNPSGIIFDLLETAIHAKENFNGTILPLIIMHPHHTILENNSDHHENTTHGIGSSISTTTTTTTTATSSSNPTLSRNSINATTPIEIDLTSDRGTPVPATTNTTTTTTTNTPTIIAQQTTIGLSSSSSLSTSNQVARSPVFFISNQVHVSLAYSNAYGEWLNSMKESVLYTADAPFPFQSLLQCGKLVALKSLHDSTFNKKFLSNSSSLSSTVGRYSSQLSLITSPLLLVGTTGQSTTTSTTTTTTTGGGYFDTTSNNHTNHVSNSVTSTTAETFDTALFALNNNSTSIRHTGSSTSSSANHNHNVSGGIWPNSSCLIFASHPSLRLGPAVHLTRVLAHGGLRSGGSIGRTSNPSHNSIILIESGDYVPLFEYNSKCLCSPELHLRRIISPFLQPNQTFTNHPVSYSQLGTPSLSISDTATVYWLPMEARIGVQQIDQLVKRCGEPRLALILPQEIYDKSFDWLNIPSKLEPFNTKLHTLSYNQQLCIPLPETRLEQVYLSSKLIPTIKPICIKLQSNNNNTTELNIENIDHKHSSHDVDSHQSINKYDVKRKLSTPATSGTPDLNKEHHEQKSLIQSDSEVNASHNKRKCIALINGILTTRDGKHWLTGKHEKLEPDIIQPVKDITTIRPITPPITTNTSTPSTTSTIATTNTLDNTHDQSKDLVQKFNQFDSENRILVCCDESSRINPNALIKKLTERGVTGAYLADSHTAHQVYSRFAVYNTHNKRSSSIQNEEVILFPNPNTMICLHDHGSHIICMDESTRTAIRDTLLLFVQNIDTYSVV
ncbi:unnamed protein product [Schistosoma turkestanicum]|nr:unnamed protein product [Schistosoma turkestanicum]